MINLLLVLLTFTVLRVDTTTVVVAGQRYHAKLYHTTSGTVIQFDRPLPLSPLQQLHAAMRRAAYRTATNHTR